MRQRAWFRDASIKSKLLLIGLLTSGFALLFVSLILTAKDIIEWRNRTVVELTTYAMVIGTNAAPAMVFDDRKAATEILSALSVKPDIVHAVIYDRQGNEFAIYQTPEHPPHPLPYTVVGAHLITFDSLTISSPLHSKGELLGSVSLESDLRGLYAGVLRSVGLIFLAAFGVFLMAAFLFARLQKIIVAPILDMAGVMQDVITKQDFAARVMPHGKDETGVLAATFNIMLEYIQLRDAELERYRMHLEEEVAQRTARLTEAQRIAHLGNWEWDIADNKLNWSDEIYHIFGLTPQQFGANYEAFMQAVHPEDRQFVDAQVRASLEQGHPYSIDHRIVRPDGSVHYVHEQAEVSRSGDGRHIKMLGTVQDITERKQAEDALRESEQKFMQLFMEVPISLGVVNKNGTIVYFNKKFTEVFGYTIDDIPTLDDWWLKAYPNETYRQWVLANWNDAVAKATKEGTEVESAEYSVTCKNGAERMVIIGGRTFEGGVLAAFNDVTERKKAEQDLRRSNTDLEQFAYAASHDMRQPLRMISSYLQLLEFDLAPVLNDETRQNLQFATEGARRMDQMLTALLDYSRVGHKTDTMAVIDSREVMDEALRYLKPAIEEAQTEVHMEGEWPRLFASHDEILRLFQNLIDNALKYRLEGRKPEVAISAQAVGGEWRLEVRDNGVGLLPGHETCLFKVFERFQPRSRYPGTGIGLALCRKIVEHHKGRIWAESPGENLGCTFIVTLPVFLPSSPGGALTGANKIKNSV